LLIGFDQTLQAWFDVLRWSLERDDGEKERLSDLTEDLGGQAEGEEFMTVRILECTVDRDRRACEVVEDETKEFGGEVRRHFRE